MPYILQTKKAWLASLSRELVLLGPGYLNAEEGHTSVSLLFDSITSVHSFAICLISSCCCRLRATSEGDLLYLHRLSISLICLAPSYLLMHGIGRLDTSRRMCSWYLGAYQRIPHRGRFLQSGMATDPLPVWPVVRIVVLKIPPYRLFLFPFMAASVWFLTLSILMLTWLARGTPRYPGQGNPYIA